MKKIISYLLNSLLWTTCFAQANKPDSFSMEKYSPSISVQDGANCYAYAGAYVTLSTQVNYSLGKLPDSTTAFSFGFVDGAINHFIQQMGEKKFKKLVDDSLYHSDTDIIGNLDYVFYILKYFGTVKFKEFPFTIKKEINDHFDASWLQRTDLFKIKSLNELYVCEQAYSDSLILVLKKPLSSGKPIVCSIHQNEADCEWEDISKYHTTTECMGNHIVTIIGYSGDNFIIKNNYAKSCIKQYPIKQFFKILKWAYTYNL